MTHTSRPHESSRRGRLLWAALLWTVPGVVVAATGQEPGPAEVSRPGPSWPTGQLLVGADGGVDGKALRLHAPTAAAAERLLEEARAAATLAKGLGGASLFAEGEQMSVEVLGDGTKRVHLPSRLLSWALVGAPDVQRRTSGPRARFVVDLDRLQGADRDGRLLLFSPEPVFAGSSISHWDPSATPDLLMEPFVSPALDFGELDVTPAVMEDLGWREGSSRVRIVSLDPPGLGFLDPRPFAGAPGNPALTLGEARRRLFETLFQRWEERLASDVAIDLLVTWRPSFCEPGVGAVLAGAGPTAFYRDGPSFPASGVWYPSALAESFAGVDLTGPPEENGGDIFLLMNSAIDEGCLAEGTSYYYGLDGREGPMQIDGASVVLHELAHGLGMLSTVDPFTGSLLNGVPGVYDLLLEDLETGKRWGDMDAAERSRSAVSFRRVAWAGSAANEVAASILTPGTPHLEIETPAGREEVEIAGARFGPAVPPGLEGDLACLRSSTGNGEQHDGCGPVTNPGEVAGAIALVDRNGCAAPEKVANAQAAGALAVVVVESYASSPSRLTGDDDGSLLIPAVAVGRDAGLALQRATCGASTLFLQGGRFEVSARWQTGEETGLGRAVEWTDQAGLFSFFDRENPELVVKILDACSQQGAGAFWVFAAGLTDVEVMVTVTDVQGGRSASYTSPSGTLFQPLADTRTFDQCP